MYFKIANFTGKTHVFESLFKKASGRQAYNLLETPTQAFSCEIGKIFKHFLSQNNSGDWFLK